MRFTVLLFACVLFMACDSQPEKPVRVDSTKDTTAQNMHDDCDSTLFPDFKNNLEDVLITLYPQYLDDMQNVADSFMTEQCAFDSLFCGEIYEKHINLYQSPDGYDLFSIGYAYVGSDSSMEYGSASFFVFGIRKNGQTIFYDFAQDLAGEIQFTLKGFEVLNGKMIVWGESYMYFANEYGKFKLTIDGSDRDWQYMCRSVN